MKKLLIGLVVVALILAVVLIIQVGQTNKLNDQVKVQEAQIETLGPVKDDLDKANDQVVTLTADKEALTAELQTAQKNQEDLTAQIQTLNDPKVLEDRSKLETDYAAMLVQYDELTQKNQELEKQQVVLSSQLEEQSKLRADLETQLKTANDQIDSFVDTIKATEEAKEEAVAMAEQTKTDALKEAEEIKTTTLSEAAQITADAAKSVEAAQADALTQVDTAKAEAQKEIETIRAESLKEVETAKAEAAIALSANQTEIEKMLNDKIEANAKESNEKIAELQGLIEEANLKATDLESKLQAELDEKTAIKADAEIKIAAAQAETAEALLQVQAAQTQAAADIAKVQEDSELAILTARTDAQTTIANAKAEAEQTVETAKADAEKQVADARAEAADALLQVQAAQTQAAADIAKVKEDSALAVLTAQTDAQTAIANAKAEAEQAKTTAIAEVETKLNSQIDETASAKLTIAQLEEKVSMAEVQLAAALATLVPVVEVTVTAAPVEVTAAVAEPTDFETPAVTEAIAVSTETAPASMKTKASIWHTFTKGQEAYLQKAVTDFNASQDKYEIDLLSQPYENFTNNVNAAVIEGTGPDIIFNYASEAARYVKSGLVADLGQFIYDPDIGIKDFDDSLVVGVMDGEVTAFEDGLIHYLPAYTTGPIFFYNKTLFDELNLKVPTTWEEMEQVAKTIYEAKDKMPALGFDSLTDLVQMFIMETEGAGYIDVKNKLVLFDTPEVRAQIEWLVDMVKKGYFLIKPSGNYFSEDFNAGIVAGYIGSSAGYPYIKPADDKFEFAMAPVPAQTWYPSWNRGPIVFYYKDDARAQSAYEFVKYFISADVNAGWAEAVVALTPYSWTKNNEAYQSFVSQDTLAAQALNAVEANLDIAGSLPAVEGANTVRDALKAAIEKAALGDMTVDEAWTEAVTVSNAALKGE